LEDFDNNEKYATHVVYFILLWRPSLVI
jgi:hypothetical protein